MNLMYPSYPWSYLVHWILLPSAIILPLAYLYSRALIQGIAYAREEQHRITPRSPWFYFQHRSERLLLFVAYLIIPWFFVTVVVPWAVNYIPDHWARAGVKSGVKYAWNSVESEFWDQVIQPTRYGDLRTSSMRTLGLVCTVFATITLLAPRIAMPLTLSMIALSPGLLFWFFVIVIEQAHIIQFTNAKFVILFLGFGIFGCSCFIFICLYVRFGLNRAWFFGKEP